MMQRESPHESQPYPGISQVCANCLETTDDQIETQENLPSEINYGITHGIRPCVYCILEESLQQTSVSCLREQLL